MIRYVVTDDTICGKPVYIAKDEADAARFLDKKEGEFKKKGQTIERQNSLYLRCTSHNNFQTFEVKACVSWEPDSVEVPFQEVLDANSLNNVKPRS